jgi:CxxC motif-containing protein
MSHQNTPNEEQNGITVLKLCCTTCPSECELTVFVDGDTVLQVEGNTCKRGEKFAYKEITTPERTLSSTIVVEFNGITTLLPVKTQSPIPKKDMAAAMKVIHSTKLNRPCKMGDVIITNICETGVDVVACRSIREKHHAC